MDYDINVLNTNVERNLENFTPDQQAIYDTVMTAVNEEKSLQLFISACDGCGKTYLLNGLLDAVCSSVQGGCIALATATTGIAADLLNLGRPFHSRFKVPIPIVEDSTLSITAQSSLAKLVHRAKPIMIDEASMFHRYALEALEHTLHDLMNLLDTPFGGKIIVMAGDFTQCIPVVPGYNIAQISNICINKFPLWRNFQTLSLTKNMRIRAGGNQRLEDFDKWTLSIGEGEANNNDEQVEIPEEHYFRINPNTVKNSKAEENSMKEFCKLIFPNLARNIILVMTIRIMTIMVTIK